MGSSPRKGGGVVMGIEPNPLPEVGKRGKTLRTGNFNCPSEDLPDYSEDVGDIGDVDWRRVPDLALGAVEKGSRRLAL